MVGGHRSRKAIKSSAVKAKKSANTFTKHEIEAVDAIVISSDSEESIEIID
jgi:hypothetical protein